MPTKLRALVDMSLRKSPDPDNPRYGEWHHWKADEVFVPPAHMNVEQALRREIVERVSENG